MRRKRLIMYMFGLAGVLIVLRWRSINEDKSRIDIKSLFWHKHMVVAKVIDVHKDTAVHNDTILNMDVHMDVGARKVVDVNKDIGVRKHTDVHKDIDVYKVKDVHKDIGMYEDMDVDNYTNVHKDKGIHKDIDIHKYMDVYLRMSTVKPMFSRLYENILVQSIRYFWPDLTSLVVVLDNERHEDHIFAENIQKRFPFPRTCFMDPINGVVYSGYDRMQRDMLYPERCTSKKYVAYVDTDTIFIARVVPEVLFDGDKPIIIAVYGNISSVIWDRAAQSTAAIFKTREVMKCMSFFPVIMKVEHMVKLRNYLEKLHNTSLENILQVNKVRFFSQFNLMCQYIWLFHRNEYTFRWQRNFKARKVSPGREDQNYYKEIITPEQTVPFPRVCDHYKYHQVYGNWQSQDTYRKLFKSSICFMGGFSLCPDKCKLFNKDSLRKEMFTFDFNYWTWDNRCLDAQRKYYQIVSKYASSNYSETIQKACDEVDNLTWKTL